MESRTRNPRPRQQRLPARMPLMKHNGTSRDRTFLGVLDYWLFKGNWENVEWFMKAYFNHPEIFSDANRKEISEALRRTYFPWREKPWKK